jgi:hypothetical protein
MCGTPAPTIEPLQALSAIPDEFSGTDQEACASSSDSQQKPPKPWLRRLIPIITVSIATIFFAWSAHEVRKSKLSKAPSAVCEECTSLASQGGKSLRLALSEKKFGYCSQGAFIVTDPVELPITGLLGRFGPKSLSTRKAH